MENSAAIGYKDFLIKHAIAREMQRSCEIKRAARNLAGIARTWQVDPIEAALSTGDASGMNTNFPHSIIVLTIIAFIAITSRAQETPSTTPPPATPPAPTYTPKFRGDPARSDSEAAALAYMRVVIRAQKQFNKQYDHFATSLAELVHSGSFTKRMVNPDRGDYTAGFKGQKDSYVLTMTPKHLDAQHRSFYAEDDGKIHADEEKPADASSPLVK